MDKCPICGHMEVVTMKKFTHAMSEYVSSDGKSAGIFNSDERTIVVEPKGKPRSELTRKDIYEETQKKDAALKELAKGQIPKPVTPASPAPANQTVAAVSPETKPLLTS